MPGKPDLHTAHGARLSGSLHQFAERCPHLQKEAPLWGTLGLGNTSVNKDPCNGFTAVQILMNIPIDLLINKMVLNVSQYQLISPSHKNMTRAITGTSSHHSLSLLVWSDASALIDSMVRPRNSREAECSQTPSLCSSPFQVVGE